MNHFIKAAAESEKFFPVMPWNSVGNDRAIIGQVKDCGFTAAGFVSPETLQTYRKASIKTIVSDPRISNRDWNRLDDKTGRARLTQP